MQNHYNLAHRADEQLIAELGKQGIAYVPFFPLGGFTPLQSQTLSDVAKRLETSPMCVALAWLLQQPTVTSVLAGASRPDQILQNAKATEISLSNDVLRRLDEATRVVKQKMGPNPDMWQATSRIR